MKIAITGGAGFIGSNLALALQGIHEVLVLDNLNSGETFENGNLRYFGSFKNLLDFKGDLVCANLNDEYFYNVLDEFKPDVIYHFAAISDTTVYNQNEVMKTNINSFYRIIDIADKHGSKLVYASSASVYGDAPSPQTIGLNERPKNPYAFSKMMMERIAKNHATKCDMVGLRYFNVYGENEFYKNKTASMVLQFGLQILSGQNPRLFEGSDKICRDFVYIKDITAANIAAMSAKSGVYNAATGKARSFESIVDILQDELVKDGTLKQKLEKHYIKNPYEKAYQFYTEANLNHSLDDFAYTPKYSLEDGIKSYLAEIKRIYKDEL